MDLCFILFCCSDDSLSHSKDVGEDKHQKLLLKNHAWLGGGFKHFLFSSRFGGRFQFWLICFKWVVQPPTSWLMFSFCWDRCHSTDLLGFWALNLLQLMAVTYREEMLVGCCHFMWNEKWCQKTWSLNQLSDFLISWTYLTWWNSGKTSENTVTLMCSI